MNRLSRREVVKLGATAALGSFLGCASAPQAARSVPSVCGVGSSRWGVGLDTWEIALMAAAGAVVVLAELSAVSLYLGTRDVPYDGPPPVGRRRFFVTASSLGNVLFLVIILMSGIAAVYHTPCQQS